MILFIIIALKNSIKVKLFIRVLSWGLDEGVVFVDKQYFSAQLLNH